MATTTTGLDPYVVLGVTEDADDETVKAAYRRRVKLAHPDRHTGADEDTRRAAEEEMTLLNWAWAEVRARRAGTEVEEAPDAGTDDAPLEDTEPPEDTDEDRPPRRRFWRSALGWLAVAVLVLTGAFVASCGVGAMVLIGAGRSQGAERLVSDFELSDCAIAVDGTAVASDCGPGVPSVAMLAPSPEVCAGSGWTPARAGKVYVCLT